MSAVALALVLHPPEKGGVRAHVVERYGHDRFIVELMLMGVVWYVAWVVGFAQSKPLDTLAQARDWLAIS